MLIELIFVPLGIGLLSVVHCVGMCGGVMGALAMGVPETVRSNRWRFLSWLLAYNFGRVGSYALVGALVGGLGAVVTDKLLGPQGHDFLRYLAVACMIMLGLYLAGLSAALVRLEGLGRGLWKILEPFGRRLMPVRSPGHALLYGAVWGWLPCGLVYAMTFTAVSFGGAWQGAVFMASFGLGTLLPMSMAGFLTGRLFGLFQQRRFRLASGLLIIILALASLWAPQWVPHPHHHAH